MCFNYKNDSFQWKEKQDHLLGRTWVPPFEKEILRCDRLSFSSNHMVTIQNELQLKQFFKEIFSLIYLKYTKFP